MGEAIGGILPLAVAAALSPIAIVAVVLLLSTDRARSNGFSFLIGWFVGIAIVGAVFLVVGGGADADGSSGGPAEWTGYAKIALGLLLLVVARRKRTSRPAAGEDAELPRWLQKIGEFDPARALAAGFVLGGLNPKNLVLTVAAATSIAGTGISSGDEAMALLVFAVISCAGAAVPLFIHLFMRDRSDQLLGRLKARMAQSGGVIIAVICVLIAAKLIGDGISTLSLF